MNLIRIEIFTFLLVFLQVSCTEFTPPEAAARRAAVGALESLTPVQRRAFGDETGFSPMPKPSPNDWLAQHPEKGQTFQAWWDAHPNLPLSPRKVIHVQPFGDFDAANQKILKQLATFMEQFFCLTVTLETPIPLQGITSRKNPHSGNIQFLTGDILDAMKRKVPKDAFCVIGVTMQDLYPDPSWNFVFGQASLKERVGIFSLARYDDAFYGKKPGPDQATIFLRRSAKVMAHETGHMFGILHDIYYQSLMSGCNHLAEADAQPIHLSPLDERKLQHSVGFDVLARAKNLETWYRANSLLPEADWTQKRIAMLTAP